MYVVIVTHQAAGLFSQACSDRSAIMVTIQCMRTIQLHDRNICNNSYFHFSFSYGINSFIVVSAVKSARQSGITWHLWTHIDIYIYLPTHAWTKSTILRNSLYKTIYVYINENITPPQTDIVHLHSDFRCLAYILNTVFVSMRTSPYFSSWSLRHEITQLVHQYCAQIYSLPPPNGILFCVSLMSN